MIIDWNLSLLKTDHASKIDFDSGFRNQECFSIG